MSTSPSHTGSLPLVYGALAPRHPKSPLHVLFVAELGCQKYQVTPLSLPKNIIGEIILVQLLKFRKQGTVWKIRLQPPLEGGLGQPACHNASDRDGSPHTAHQVAILPLNRRRTGEARRWRPLELGVADRWSKRLWPLSAKLNTGAA